MTNADKTNSSSQDLKKRALEEKAKLNKEYQSKSESLTVMANILTDDRKSQRAILSKALFISLSINVLLGLALYSVSQPKTVPLVLEKLPNGNLARISTNPRVNYSLQDVMDFAQRRATNVHNWGYKNFVQVLEDERPYWKNNALQSYVNQLVAQGTFKAAKSYRRRFESTVTHRTLVQQMKYDGIYHIYRVVLKLNEDEIDIEGLRTNKWKITIDVREVNPSSGNAGLQVERYDEVLVK